jgi:hypothetical protein
MSIAQLYLEDDFSLGNVKSMFPPANASGMYSHTSVCRNFSASFFISYTYMSIYINRTRRGTLE